MSSLSYTRDRLAARALSLLDEYKAMLVLLALMNTSVRSRLERKRAAIRALNKTELRKAIADLETKIKAVRDEAGATLPVGHYASLLRRVRDQPGRVLRITALGAVGLFSRYPHISDALKRGELPPHTFIELDARGEYPPNDGLELHLMEVNLYEDMCLFWNDSCDVVFDPKNPYGSKRVIKRLRALLRAAVSSAFYMVEAYLNGLAYEVVVTRGDQLSEREREMVTEWDYKRARTKYLTIRDKALQYPRLLSGVPAPRLQENNCPELEFFLTKAKNFRDAIVHANPAPRPDTLELEKEELFARLTREDAGRIVDSAILVVEQIAAALEPTRTVFWLHRRQDDGRFSTSVFH